jgi:hypothetical protein
MAHKRQGHRSKALNEISKNSTPEVVSTTLKDQYEVIRKDLIKLRMDLQKGWTIARESLTKRPSVSSLKKSR